MELNKKLLLISLAIWLSGCNGSDSVEDQSQIDAAQDSWLNLAISDYSFHYKVTGFAPDSGQLWAVEVRDDEVFDVVFVGEGESSWEPSVESMPTVSDLFGRISGCKLSHSCEVVRETYHQEFFFPVKYVASYGEEGAGFEVSNFTAL